jgi:hypothetical protein
MIPGGIAGNSRDRKGAYLCVPYEEWEKSLPEST